MTEALGELLKIKPDSREAIKEALQSLWRQIPDHGVFVSVSQELFRQHTADVSGALVVDARAG